MNKLLLCVGFALCSFTVFSQEPTRFQIQGTIIDSSDAPLPSASVMLLQRKDSSLVNFTRTNDKGAFSFKNVKKGDLLLKVSYVGYLPLDKEIVFGNETTIDLGNVKLKPMVKALFEVVIKAARAPMTIKGDTIEYNAASFKVPPGSTVEDLLKKLPGVQIDQDGNIKAQGQDVKKVLVDGKSFFGNDPKMATKNLSAEAITKIQVFNDKTEQSKLTGIDDGKKEKAVNLELKDEFKKGGFGKMTAGVGTDERGMLKGNYNKFDKTNQYSLIGAANNVNQSGMSYDDFQDFKGSNTYNWDDNADFGFTSGMRFFYGSDDGEGGIDIPVGGSRGRGFSNNISTGINYNYDTKKDKLSASYYYNSTRQMIDAIRFQQNFLKNDVFATNDTSSQTNFYGNHRISLRYQKTLDTLNTIVIFSNGRMNQGNLGLFSHQKKMLQTDPISTSKINNTTLSHRAEMSNNIIFRHKFSKKGRNFGISASYNFTNTDGEANVDSDNQFFKAKTLNDQLRAIRQLQISNSRQQEIKSSLLWTEPFANKFYWETFYNFSVTNREVDRDVNDNIRTEKPKIDSLGTYYTNLIVLNRIGTGVRYSYKGTNVMVGLAGQHFSLLGDFARDQTSPTSTNVTKDYVSLLPAVSINMDLKNNKYLWSDYNARVQQPSIRDLQPVVNNTNPLYIQEGNPNLLPSISHDVYMGFNIFDPASFMSFNTNLGYSYQINQIVYNQTVDTKTLITKTKPMNVTGGSSKSIWANFSFPIVKTKATMSLSTNIYQSQNITFINDIQNNTNNINYNFRPRLDLTPVDWFTAYVNVSVGIVKTKYSINTAQNQQVYNNEYTGDFNIKFPKNIYLNSNFSLRTYKNDRFGFDQSIPIWNTSVYAVLGKAKKTELRLTAYDMLNRNLGVSQSAYQNFVSQEKVQTLARYFMLSYTYNMRGINANIKKRSSF